MTREEAKAILSRPGTMDLDGFLRMYEARRT
jgi:hypothetical protein